MPPATVANLATAPFSHDAHRRREAFDAFKAFWTTVKGTDVGTRIGAFPVVHDLVKALALSAVEQDESFSSGGVETQVAVLESFDSAGPDVASLLQPTQETADEVVAREASDPAATMELDNTTRLDEEEEDEVALLPTDPAPQVEETVGPTPGTPSSVGDFFEETASVADPDKAVILEAPSDSSPEPELDSVILEAFQGSGPSPSNLVDVDEALASSASESEAASSEPEAKAEKGRKGSKKRKRKSAIGASKKKNRSSSQSSFVSSSQEEDGEDGDADGIVLVPFKYATAEEKERSRSLGPASSAEEGGPSAMAVDKVDGSVDAREGEDRRKRTLTRITSGASLTCSVRRQALTRATGLTSWIPK